MSPTLPGTRVTDTTFHPGDFQAFTADRPAHEAVMGWCRKHGIAPERVMARDPIVRDEGACQVRCTYFGEDEDGNRIRAGLDDGELVTFAYVAQGETPPLPWPPELDRYRVDEPHGNVAVVKVADPAGPRMSELAGGVEIGTVDRWE